MQELTDCLHWSIQTNITIQKGIKPKIIIYQKVLSIIILSLSMKKFLWPTENSDIKRYDRINITECFLDYYYYVKDCYRLIAVDLSPQRKLDADLKAIQQKEFIGQLKNSDDNDAEDADGRQSIFVLMILERKKKKQKEDENSLKGVQQSCERQCVMKKQKVNSQIITLQNLTL